MVLVTPYDARTKRLRRILRLVLLLSLGTLFALLYWLFVAFFTFRKGGRVRLSPEDGSGDSRLKEILLRAYPEGVEGEEYRALLGFLSKRVPADTIARTVADTAHREIAVVLADVSQTQAAGQEDEIRARLEPHGFDDWVRRYA